MSNDTLAPRDFMVWQQAIFEMIGNRLPTEAEWKMIQEKHQMTFGAVVTNDLMRRIEEDSYAAKKHKEILEMQEMQLQKMKHSLTQPYNSFPGALGGYATASNSMAGCVVESAY